MNDLQRIYKEISEKHMELQVAIEDTIGKDEEIHALKKACSIALVAMELLLKPEKEFTLFEDADGIDICKELNAALNVLRYVTNRYQDD